MIPEGYGDVAVVTVRPDSPTVLMSTLADPVTAIIAAGATMTVLDLTGAEYIDTSGLAALVGLHRTLETEGRQLIVACSHSVRRVFELSALHHRITIADSVRSARTLWGTSD